MLTGCTVFALSIKQGHKGTKWGPKRSQKEAENSFKSAKNIILLPQEAFFSRDYQKLKLEAKIDRLDRKNGFVQ